MERKKKRKKTRKPKVVLQKRQVIILTLAIVAVCACMLIVTILTIPSENNIQFAKEGEVEEIVNIEETESVATVKKSIEKDDFSTSTKTPAEEIIPSAKDSEVQQQPSQPEERSQQRPQQELPQSQLSQPQQPVKQDNVAIEQTVYPGPFDSVEAAVNNATLILVLDDGGQNLSHLQHFLELPFAFDVAVLPKLQYSAQTATRVRAAGKEVMLHQPMQAINLSVNPGPGAITPEMHTYDIEALVLENIQEVGPVAGLNNHEGSLITQSASKIGAVLDVCDEQGIFFLDSRTTAETQAPQAALERGFHIWERDIFLDNTQEREDIIQQILQAIKIANRDGYAIMIGHVWSADNLATILLEMYNALEPKGYRFSTIGALNENFGN